MSCNLNCSGGGRRGTRTELKHVEDRQAHAWLPRGGEDQTDHMRSGDMGGVTTLVRVNEGGRRPQRITHF